MKLIKTKKYSILLNILKYSFIGIFATILILPTLFISDNIKKAKAVGTPQITSFSPTSGKVGDLVVINGQNLGDANEVFFHTASANPTTYDNNPNKITVNVPSGAQTGKITVRSVIPPDGIIINTVSTNNFTVNSNSSPTISNINPLSGKVDDIITITGQNLLGGTKVVFNTKETVTITNTETQITVKVPEGATNGKIKVITNSGSASSTDNFTVSSNGDVVTPPAGPNDGGSQEDVYEYGGVKFKGLVPVCNTEVDPVKGGFKDPCDFNMVMSLVNRFINFLLITLATPLFALIMIYVGWLYLSDMGNAENVTKAKKIFKNVFLGYVIALAAWLIINTIIASLVPGTSSILGFFKNS